MIAGLKAKAKRWWRRWIPRYTAAQYDDLARMNVQLQLRLADVRAERDQATAKARERGQRLQQSLRSLSATQKALSNLQDERIASRGITDEAPEDRT